MTEPGPAVALDQRPTAACHVQLKSTAGESTGRVALRLSAIERLAKDVRPALIVVFRLRSDGEGVGGYVVHLLGEQLARVLKRLRAAQARKAFDVNQASISFDYRKVGTKFALTPEGLRDALISVCGNDPARYVVEKQRQLDELGYENGRLEAEALVWLEGPEHLNNILLGLIPLKPTRLRAFDSRFGIRIPYVGPLFDDIRNLTSAQPHVGNCDVSIRGPGLTPAAVFTAEMYIGPPIEAIGGPQLLIRHPDFTLKFRADGMNFETTGAFDISLRPLQRWTELIRALSHMATGRGVITIFESGRFPRITLPVEQPIEGPCIEQLPQLAQFLDGWQKLLSMAGVKSSATFSMEEICDSPGAGFAVDVLCNP